MNGEKDINYFSQQQRNTLKGITDLWGKLILPGAMIERIITLIKNADGQL